ncbi:hypothetical protein ACFL20_05545 [Spirochaetota bacterium]
MKNLRIINTSKLIVLSLLLSGCLTAWHNTRTIDKDLTGDFLRLKNRELKGYAFIKIPKLNRVLQGTNSKKNTKKPGLYYFTKKDQWVAVFHFDELGYISKNYFALIFKKTGIKNIYNVIVALMLNGVYESAITSNSRIKLYSDRSKGIMKIYFASEFKNMHNLDIKGYAIFYAKDLLTPANPFKSP